MVPLVISWVYMRYLYDNGGLMSIESDPLNLGFFTIVVSTVAFQILVFLPAGPSRKVRHGELPCVQEASLKGHCLKQGRRAQLRSGPVIVYAAVHLSMPHFFGSTQSHHQAAAPHPHRLRPQSVI